MACLIRAETADLKQETKGGKGGRHRNSLGLFMVKCNVLIRVLFALYKYLISVRSIAPALWVRPLVATLNCVMQIK